MSLFRESLVYVRYIHLNSILESHSININKILKEIMNLGEYIDNKKSEDLDVSNYLELVDKINLDVDKSVDNLKFNISEANKVILNIANLMKVNNLTEEELVERDLLFYEILSLYDRYYV